MKHNRKAIAGFACDRTLGRLAKWLRILGYDTLYWNSMDDAALIARCNSENRILLTRNTRLLKYIGTREHMQKPDYCYIPRNDFRQQLKDVMEKFSLDDGNKFTRCSECNTGLEDVDKDDVEGHVPDYIFETQKIFKQCPGCGKYFWHGTHVERMLDHLKHL
jgi:uncharacterized protein with PIN domain